MNKSLRYVSAAAAAQLAACSAEPARQSDAASTPARPAAAKPAEQASERLILALGDSLYAGYGLRQNQSLPAVLERDLEAQGIPARVVNAGVSGDTTAGGRARLAFTLDGLPRKPDLALVGLGANDALRGVDPAETRRNLDAILAELDRRGIPILLTGMVAPPNLGGDYFRRFNAIFPELAKQYDAELYPFILEGVITRPDLLLGDRMHPNAQGVEVMARGVAPLAARRLKEGQTAAAS